MDKPKAYYTSENKAEEEAVFLTVTEFFGGWISGVAGLIVSHPFDTIKVLQQRQGNLSMLAISQNIIKTEGINAFYKGLLLPIQTTGIESAVFFGVYANTLRYWRILMANLGKSTSEFTDNFVAGSVGGFAQTIFAVPTQIVKIRQQTDIAEGRKKLSMFDTCKVVFKDKGVGGFFRGFLATAVREVPSGGLYFAFYVTADRFCQQYIPPYWAHCFAGGFAGAASYAPFQPADVIKTRLQSDDLSNPKYHGTLDCIRQIYKEEGVAGFGRGLMSQNIRSFICNSVIFVVYEFFMDAVEHFNL